MGNCLTLEEYQSQQRKPNRVENGKGTVSRSHAPDTSGVVSILAAPKDVEDLRQVDGYGGVCTFTYDELRAATKNFRPDQILGEGGFGIVYKGYIDTTIRPDFSPTQVAVKELNREGFQGDREWLAEVRYLGQFSHPNLVKLIGYCCEGTHRLLVYEYMACGSLEKHLFRRICLTMPWSNRMKIALGAAKGLAFLHGAERPIIYRDFKTSNILLDSEYNAKLSDFGLAKEGPMGDQTHVSTRVMGTYGYAAPEYVMTGHLTARSDVYGFGVVLLEMLIGRKAMDKSRPSREHNLAEWARPLLIHNKKLLKIADPRMEGQYTIKQLQKVALLAYQCLSQNPKGRPSMNQVVETLEDVEDLSETGEAMLLQSDGNAVTLYEVPKDAKPDKDCNSPTANAPHGNKFSSKAHGKPSPLPNPKVIERRTSSRMTNGRSKSEPPKEFQLGIHSSYSDDFQRPLSPL